MQEKQINKERLKDIVNSIEGGIQDVFQSGKYDQYLRTMSRFHRYSVNNQMLIFLQKPDATLVAGFNKWKDQFGRNVMKGQKGIQIIAPTPFKKKIEKVKLDPDTKTPLLDRDGNAIVEEREVQIPMFKPVFVFDVSQTQGKPLPQLAADLAGDVHNYEVFMEALRRSSPVPITIEAILDGADGYFSLTDQRIVIREGMSEIQTVSAVVHEIAHSKLHNTEKSVPEGEDTPIRKDRNTEEVEAESISFAVCTYYGIETGENSFGYLANWSKDKELKELRSSLETINTTSSELITDIDRHYAAIMKEREANMEQEKPQTEAFYQMDDRQYLHLQYSDSGAWNYSTYDKEKMLLLDGGFLDEPEFTLEQAREAFLKWVSDPPVQIAEIPMEEAQHILNELHTQAEQVVPTVSQEFPPLPPNEGTPDCQLLVEDMFFYGYTADDMFPVCKDRALELHELDVPLYTLYTNNKECLVLDQEDILLHKGIFGVTKADWDAVKSTVPDHDPERRFLDCPDDAFLIYQLKRDEKPELSFMALDRLKEPPVRENYNAIYNGTLEDRKEIGVCLEDLYCQFNNRRPMDFTGHSLSISDIVALKQDGKVSYHYCDTIGFKEISAFVEQKQLQQKERRSVLEQLKVTNAKAGKQPVKQKNEKEITI